jgi:hypothetical protein
MAEGWSSDCWDSLFLSKMFVDAFLDLPPSLLEQLFRFKDL